MDIIEPLRHLAIIDPADWGDRRIDIIGCGTSGSHLAQEIGRLGIENLHLHDHDVIEAHNIANQLYPLRDIGVNKARALSDQLYLATGTAPTIHERKVEGRDPEDDFGEIVFLCVDSMSARLEIVEQRLEMNPTTQLVIDTRMGVDELRVYNFCPYRASDVRKWKETITADEDTVENACQMRTTIGGTAAVLAGLASWQFLQWYRREIANDVEYEPLPFEITMMLRPPIILTR